MAALAPRDFHRLVLVGAMGVKPPEGDIFDQAIVSYIDYAQAGFHDQAAFARIYGDVSTDQLVAWDLCREMSFRIAWKPYMYSQTLPHLLGGVRAPALVVWGDDDKIVPKSAGERYVGALARGAPGDRARRRALRRHGAARGARPPRRPVHRAELTMTKYHPSPPRKRGPRASDGGLDPWVPAFAGMTNRGGRTPCI